MDSHKAGDDATVSTRDLLRAAQAEIDRLRTLVSRPDATRLIGARRVKVFQWYVAPGMSVVQARNAFVAHGLSALKVHPAKIRTTPRKGYKIVHIAVLYQRAERP